MAKQAKKKTKAFGEMEVSALVSSYISNSQLLEKSELGEKRRRALNYSLGEMLDTPSKENRSSAVSRDVSDVIGWMLPGIMRVFTSSGQLVVYNPTRPEHEEHNKQATEYINHIFMKECKGYQIISDSAQDALLLGNGIIKHYWDDTPETETEFMSGINEDQLTEILDEEGVELLAQTETEEMVTVEGPAGLQEIPVKVYEIKIQRTIRTGKIKIEVIKPDHFLIDTDAENIDDGRFRGHWEDKTRSELMEMGFDKAKVDMLPAHSATGTTQGDLDQVRKGSRINEEDIGDRSTDLIRLYESYMQADVDGDGVSELIQVFSIGDGDASTVLDWEIWEDDHPFSDVVSERIPHTFDGRALSDELMDIQQQKTVLLRGLLDNIYAVNNPQKEAEVGSVKNPKELSAPTYGGTIWRTSGSTPINTFEVEFVGDKVLGALEYMDQIAEKRTGVSRSTMALDPGVLQNQTAEGVREGKDSSYSKIELNARWLAFGYERMFMKILKLVIKHQDAPREIKIGEDWVTVDPAPWSASMTATVNTGLGTGSRDRDLSMLQQVLMQQYALLDRFQAAQMISEAVDMIPKITATLQKMCEAAGLDNAEQYYPDFKDEELEAIKKQMAEQASQPDPEQEAKAQKIQADMQQDQTKLQMEMAQAKQKAALEIEKLQASIAADQQKIEMEMSLKREAAVMDMELKREQVDAELAMKREQVDAELEMKALQFNAEMELKREMALKGLAMGAASETNMNSTDVNVGGEPG